MTGTVLIKQKIPHSRPVCTDSDPDAGSEKIQVLEKLLGTKGKIAIAFSGGVDSCLLAAVAQRTCRQPPVALTGASPFQSRREIEFAGYMAGKIGIVHEVLGLDLLGDDRIIRNSDRRCYFCKKKIFSAIREHAQNSGAVCLVHGINLDDLNDFRPGIQAAEELGFEAPFVEAGFSKDLIRRVSKKIGLDSWNRPSQSCLATRIPYGSPITGDLLARIEQAENYMNDLGLDTVRVRCHGTLARIEIEERAMGMVLENRKVISRHLKHLGFEFITVDIEKYRSAGV